MAKHSKDIDDDVAAHNAIVGIEDVKELQAFIKGEQREALLDLAAFRLNALKNSSGSGVRSSESKQGETGPITQNTADFKGTGVQGTKGADVTGSTPNSEHPALAAGHSQTLGASLKTPNSISGQDIIQGLDEAAEKKAKEAAVKGASAANSETKSAAELRKERGIVTCEDVLENMRAEGKKV